MVVSSRAIVGSLLRDSLSWDHIAEMQERKKKTRVHTFTLTFSAMR
jgi:hypothetical protein